VNYLPGWLQTVVLLISAFLVAGITDINHWCPAGTLSSKVVFFSGMTLDLRLKPGNEF
jgi:hypothetical protein